MPGYHLFLLDAADRTVGRREVEAGSDTAAVAAGAELLASDVPAFAAVDIWQGARKVRRLNRPRTRSTGRRPRPAARADAASEASRAPQAPALT
jgi:hypothetical protein